MVARSVSRPQGFLLEGRSYEGPKRGVLRGQRAQTRSVCKQSKFYSAAMSQELAGGRVVWGAVSCHPLSSGVFEHQAQGWTQESLGTLVC